jgi:hypothetical protein
MIGPDFYRGRLNYGPFLKEEEFMTSIQIKRLIRVHERAEWHIKEYLRFSTDPSTESKALSHLRKAARLHSQISGIISDSASIPAYTGGENFLVETHPGL